MEGHPLGQRAPVASQQAQCQKAIGIDKMQSAQIDFQVFPRGGPVGVAEKFDDQIIGGARCEFVGL